MQLFNLKLAKSNLRKQLNKNCELTTQLQERILELETWRLQYSSSMADE